MQFEFQNQKTNFCSYEIVPLCPSSCIYKQQSCIILTVSSGTVRKVFYAIPIKIFIMLHYDCNRRIIISIEYNYPSNLFQSRCSLESKKKLIITKIRSRPATTSTAQWSSSNSKNCWARNSNIIYLYVFLQAV